MSAYRQSAKTIASDSALSYAQRLAVAVIEAYENRLLGKARKRSRKKRR